MMNTKGIMKILLGLLMAALLAGTSGCDVLTGTQTEPTPAVVPLVVTQTNIKAEGTIVPVDSASLWFSMNGKVTEILVAEGDEVSAGQMLARLEDSEQMDAAVSTANLELLAAQKALKALQDQASLVASQAWVELQEAKAALVEAEARLEALDTEDNQKKIDDAAIKVSDARDELDTAQEDFDKYKDLEEDNATRKDAERALTDAEKKYNDARHEHDRLINDLEQAKANIQLVEDSLADAQRRYDFGGPDPEDLALAEARVKNAEAQISAAESARDNLYLSTPIAGTVVKIDFVIGEEVAAYQPLVVVADFSQWVVETNDLTEIEVVNIATGDEVEIIPDALPDVTLNGTVESIEDMYAVKYGDITYTTRIRLDSSDPRLRWGMTVAVNFKE